MRRGGAAPAILVLIGLAVAACSTAGAPASATGTASASPSPTEEPTPMPVPTAGAFPESLVAGLRTETDVPFTRALPCAAGECEVPLDILAPQSG